MTIKVGDLVRDKTMNYKTMPGSVADVMTYVVVEINKDTVGVAHKNIIYRSKEVFNVWLPMIMKIEDVEFFSKGV